MTARIDDKFLKIWMIIVATAIVIFCVLGTLEILCFKVNELKEFKAYEKSFNQNLHDWDMSKVTVWEARWSLTDMVRAWRNLSNSRWDNRFIYSVPLNNFDWLEAQDRLVNIVDDNNKTEIIIVGNSTNRLVLHPLIGGEVIIIG